MSDSGGITDVAGDPEAAQARIQQWAQGFAAKAERYHAVREQTEQLRLHAASSDGSVRVTVRADGTVADLRFTEKIRSMPLTDLSELILATMRSAQSGIADRVGEVMAEQVGDDDQQTRAVVLDNLRERFPEQDDETAEAGADPLDIPDEGDRPVRDTAAPTASPARPRRRPRHDDDDDDFDANPLRDD